MSASHSAFQYRGDLPPQPPPPDSLERRDLTRLRTSTSRLNRGFVTANAVGFALMALLAFAPGDLVGTEVVGPITLGILLGLAQVALLMWTAARYDINSVRRCDPEAEALQRSFPLEGGGR